MAESALAALATTLYPIRVVIVFADKSKARSLPIAVPSKTYPPRKYAVEDLRVRLERAPST